MRFETEYDLGEMVYLITDPDQFKRMIIEISFTPNEVSYKLALGDTESWHYEIEIDREPDIVTKTSN